MNGALAGLRVVNTRAARQAAELDQALIDAGASPLSYPCIEIVPPDDTTALETAMTALISGEFEWLVFTSVNTVSALDGKLDGQRIGAKVAAIGPSTARAVERELGLNVSIVPDVPTALDLAVAVPIKPGDRVLLPASEIARSNLEQALTRRGAVVTRLVAYSTVIGSGGVNLPRLLADGLVDALTFASPSAIQGLLARFRTDGGSSWSQFALPAVCIGNITSDAAAKLGFTSVVAATPQSVEGLVAALESVFSTRLQGGRTWP